MAGVRRGVFTCIGWQVILCDPIRQVTSLSSEVGFPQEELYRPFFRSKRFKRRLKRLNDCLPIPRIAGRCLQLHAADEGTVCSVLAVYGGRANVTSPIYHSIGIFVEIRSL